MRLLTMLLSGARQSSSLYQKNSCLAWVRECCGRAMDGRSEVGDLGPVGHGAHGSACAGMLAHGVVVEVCEVSEFGHTKRSSRIGDMAKEAMAGRIDRKSTRLNSSHLGISY